MRDLRGAFATKIEMSGPELVAALYTPFISARNEAALDRALKEATFGMPSFNVGGQLIWGNDRRPLLEHAPAQRMTTVSGD